MILRRELQKCLGVVKEKRMELSTLRSEMDQRRNDQMRTESELDIIRNKLDSTQVRCGPAALLSMSECAQAMSQLQVISVAFCTPNDNL